MTTDPPDVVDADVAGADAVGADAEPTDALATARSLVRVNLGIAVIGVAIALLIGPAVRLAEDPRPALQRIVPAPRLTFAPAGRVQRAPASHPSIVPHFRPGLARLAPDVDRWLVRDP